MGIILFGIVVMKFINLLRNEHMNKIIYTSITNNFEKVRNDILVLSNSAFPSSRKCARFNKCFPPVCDYSLWIDGNTFPKFNIDYYIDNFLNEHDMCVFKHPIRDCIYDEAEACSILSLDDSSIIKSQMDKYRKENYPSHNGLAATTYVLRRHTHKILEFNDLWWTEINNGSIRDQLSFDYCCWKLDIKYNTFPETHFDNFKHNSLFTYNTHGE